MAATLLIIADNTVTNSPAQPNLLSRGRAHKRQPNPCTLRRINSLRCLFVAQGGTSGES